MELFLKPLLELPRRRTLVQGHLLDQEQRHPQELLPEAQRCLELCLRPLLELLRRRTLVQVHPLDQEQLQELLPEAQLKLLHLRRLLLKQEHPLSPLQKHKPLHVL